MGANPILPFSYISYCRKEVSIVKILFACVCGAVVLVACSATMPASWGSFAPLAAGVVAAVGSYILVLDPQS